MSSNTNKENKTYEDAIEMVLDVIAEMQVSFEFDNATLHELEQRIV